MKKIFYLLFFVTICLLCVDCERGDEDFNLKISGEHEKHGYVDLGLSVKWATCNIGAINPEEYGDYFAWGEVEPKEVYDWSTYRYGLDWNQVIKYCDNDYCGKDGFVDDKMELDPEDDAATMNWGGDWRMPTNVEMDELKTQCSWTWITLNEIDGYLVTSNVVGYTDKSIFLPAAGIVYHDGVSNVGLHGYYWSKSLFRGSPGGAHVMEINLDYIDRYPHSRELGLSVRAVCP